MPTTPTRLIVLIVAALLAGAGPLVGQTVRPGRQERVAKLLDVLKSNASQEEKRAACRELAIVGTKEAVPVLAALLADPDLSHAARYALEPLSDPAVDEALRKALDEVKGRALVGVIGSVGVRRDAKAVQRLARLLEDPDRDVVQAAARALGGIGSVEAAQPLAAALVAASAETRLALCEGLFRAAESLADAGHRDHALAIYDGFLKLADAPPQVRTGAVRGAILVLGKDGLPSLRRYLRSDDDLLFTAAVRTTYEMPEHAVTVLLVEALQRTDAPDRQVLLIQSLASRKDPWALSRLWTHALGGPRQVRLAAIRAVAEAGAAAMASALVPFLDDPDPELAHAARESLAVLPGYLVWATRPGLSVEQRLVICRIAAGTIRKPEEKRLLLTALGGIPSSEAIGPILPYLNEPEMREEAAAALVSVAESLLRGQNAKQAASELIGPLAEVARLASNAEVVRRAKAALEQAKKQAK